MVNSLAFLCISMWCLCQEPSQSAGIYIIQEPFKKGVCANESRMVIGKKRVCLSRKPILSKEEIEYSSDIKYDPVFKVHYIEVGVSQLARNTLHKTVTSLPDTKFALVLGGEVICLFIIQNEFTTRIIRIGEDITLSDLKMIDERLKKIDF